MLREELRFQPVWVIKIDRRAGTFREMSEVTVVRIVFDDRGNLRAETPYHFSGDR